MTLPHLAGVLAVREPGADARAALRERLRTTFGGDVWEPAPGWIVARRDLPGGGPPPGERDAGVAFAEGGEAVAAARTLRAVGDLALRNPRRLAELPGDFTFLAFGAAGELTAVRSCAGRVPLYVWRRGERAAVATRYTDLVRFGGGAPWRLDPLVNAMWASTEAVFPDERTFLDGVTLIRAGHAARLEATDAWRQVRYWDLRPPGETKLRASPEHPQRLRRLLLDGLERELDPSGGNLLSLSGGVDSTTLAALSAGAVGRPVDTVTLLPHVEHTRARELHYIDGLAADVPLGRRLTWTWDHEVAEGYMRRHSGPAFWCLHPVLLVLPEVIEQLGRVRVYFGGEYADDVCGHWWRMHDWVEQTSLAQLLLGVRRLPLGRTDLGRWPRWRARALMGRFDMPGAEQLRGLFAEDIRSEHAEWRERRRRRLAGDERPNRYLALAADLLADGPLAMNWEIAAAHGVRRAWPFWTRETLELAGECPASELLGPGVKRLLREAVSDLVPARNLYREDKGAWGREEPPPPPPEPWTDPVPERVRQLLSEDVEGATRPFAAPERLALLGLTAFDRTLDAVQDCCT